MSRPNAHHRKKQNGYKKPQQGQAKIVKKKTIDDYYFYIGSAKQAADYNITSEFCINHIKKTYDYGDGIAKSLNELVKPDTDTWFPSLI
eukprot:12920420-Ditylum_brightwellii.AAC.1